jgi:coenzyme F420 hydrogenase subunit beta
MNPSVIREIVEKNLCIGCGVCTAVCPSDYLKIGWNRFGEYNPVEKITCDKECGLCLKVCPFADENDNENTIGKTLYGDIPGIYHCTETGYYLDSYVGYASENRLRGASGGMATWFLSTLLKRGIVDYVIAVVPTISGDRLFKFSVLSDPASVLDSSGSVYYPVELSGVLREIQKNPGKYAILGLPCFIKALRLAQKRNKILRQTIIITAGLTCGQLKSRFFTSYIAALLGIGEDDLKQVHYRGKSQDKPASNYYYTFTRKNGTSERIFWNEGVSNAWLNHWFTINSCNYCDDIFAECADVTFMDARLPEYVKDSRGTSIVLVRSQLVHDVVSQGILNNEITLEPIPIENVKQSEADVIDVKRRYLTHQLFLAHQRGLKTPEKRVTALKLANPFLLKEIILKNQMQGKSREIWDPQNPDAKRLNVEMQLYLTQLIRLSKFSRIIIRPVSLFRSIQRKIRSHFHG